MSLRSNFDSMKYDVVTPFIPAKVVHERPFRINISSSVNAAGTVLSRVEVNQNKYSGPCRVKVLSVSIPKVDFVSENEPGLYVRSSLPQPNAWSNNPNEPSNILCFCPNKGYMRGTSAADLTDLAVETGLSEQCFHQSSDNSYIYTHIPYSFDIYLTTALVGGLTLPDLVVTQNWVLLLEVIPII
jgi:hypothetical protein